MTRTLILTTRNDEYYPDLLTKLQMCIESYRMVGITDCIVVEYDPPATSPRIREALPGLQAKIITIGHKLTEDLQADGGTMPFYEYAGKNVGAFFAEGEELVIANPDNLIYQFMQDPLAADEMRAATLFDIEPNQLSVASTFYDFEDQMVPVYRIMGCAHGDFIHIRRDAFLHEMFKGYTGDHIPWGVDNDLVARFAFYGGQVVRPNVTLHMYHRERKNKPRTIILGTPISREIWNNLVSYVVEAE